MVPIFLSYWPCWIFGIESKPNFYILLTLVTLSFQEGLVVCQLFLGNYYFTLQLYTQCTHGVKCGNQMSTFLKISTFYIWCERSVYTQSMKQKQSFIL